MLHRTHIGEDPYTELARVVVAGLRIAAQSDRPFCIALPGGKTPETFFKTLVRDFREAPWAVAQFFFSDERAVGPEHPESNYRAAHEHLLGPLAISPHRIHRIQGEAKNLDLEADRYAHLMRKHVTVNDAGIPQFDMMILGLGADGHIASLFPETKVLNETGRWVAPVLVAKLCAWRVTFTFPVLNAALQLAVLATGEQKAQIIAEVVANQTDSPPARSYPACLLKPVNGVDWYLDSAAAARIVSK